MNKDAILVHVSNPEDFAITQVEEHAPEHFVLSTVVIAHNVAGYSKYEQVLADDPLRQDWSIMANDAPVVLCSKAQLTDPANQVSGVPYPQGGSIPQGGAITGTGPAQLFAVATSATPNRISIFVNGGSRLWFSRGAVRVSVSRSRTPPPLATRLRRCRLRRQSGRWGE